MRFSYLLALAASLAPNAWATIDNSDASDALTAAAVTLVAGDYTLTNVQTGQVLNFIDNDKQLFPGTGDASPVSLTISPDGPYMRMGAGGKCLSAQWGYDEAGKGIGADAAGVLYACAVGQGAVAGSTVEKTKQWWLFVPVAGASNGTSSNLLNDSYLSANSGTGNNASNTTTDGCKKSEGWIQRHPQYVKSANFNHTECASLLSDTQKAKLGFSNNSKRSAAHLVRRGTHQAIRELALERRGANTDVNGGTFNIITLDHLLDMPTRALSGSVKVIEGSKTTDMEVYDADSTLQQWVLAAAS